MKDDLAARLDRGLEFNYFSLIEKFVKRTGAHSFNLIFDTSGLTYGVEPELGYLCNEQPPLTLTAPAPAASGSATSAASGTASISAAGTGAGAGAAQAQPTVAAGSSAATAPTAAATAAGASAATTASDDSADSNEASASAFVPPQGLKAWPAVFFYGPNLVTKELVPMHWWLILVCCF